MNYIKQLEIKELNKDEWEEHLLNLNRKYTNRRNHPDIEKQAEANKCLDALSLIEELLKAVPEDYQYIHVIVSIALVYFDAGLYDKKKDLIYGCIKGDKEDIKEVLNDYSLPRDIIGLCRNTLGTFIKEKENSNKEEYESPIVHVVENSSSPEKKKQGSKIIVLAIIAVLVLSAFLIPKVKRNNEPEEERELSIGEQLMAQAEEKNKIIAEREAELEEKHRQEEANIKMVTLAMEVPFNRMKMGERNYAYFIPENSKAQNTKGNTYTNALALWKSIGIEQVFKATIYLDDVYEKFSCVVGCYQNTNSEFSVGKTGEHLFEIYLNAQPEPAFSTMISYDSEPIQVELDLKGIYYITFKYGEGENDQKGAIVGDGKLYKTIEVSEKEVEDYLGRTDIFYRIQNTTSK